MQNKAEDAGGLTPARDNNAATFSGTLNFSQCFWELL